MADLRLRRLERKWKETGSLEDEATYLLEALRTGALSQESLELASDLGHRPARRVLEREPLQAADLAEHGNFIRQRWGQWQLVRASLTVARSLLPDEEPPLSAERVAARDVLDAVAAWLKSPQTARPVRVLQRRLAHEECVAWAGEAVAGSIRETLWAVTSPPAQGSSSTRGCEALAHGCAALGMDGLLQVLAQDLIPKILAVEI
jgi:hypothetical protein